MTSINNIGSIIEAYLSTNKKDSDITASNNKSAAQVKYSEDSYIPSTTEFATSLGIYSKSVKEEGFSEEEYERYCCLAVVFETSERYELVYYPPPNAPYTVKKAWIETMKLLTDEELVHFKQSILDNAGRALGKEPTQMTAELYQNYFNNHTSYKDIVDLFSKELENSKEALARGEGDANYSQLIEKMLNGFKMYYEMYVEE